MNYRDLRIVFMGTPEFAVASLAVLYDAGCHIAGVVTAPDRPAGRGMKLAESAVKKYAADKGLKILQPEKLKAPSFIEELTSLQAHLQVVVAFRMLPEVVWDMPPLGTVNLHASLLPAYRGAAPINWAIINGEKETGITTFKLQQAIDTGNILLQEKIMIREDETAGELHDELQTAGAKLLLKTVIGLAEQRIEEKPQSNAYLNEAQKHAPKIFTDTCRIDWSKTANEIYNLIRGLSPYPAAFTDLNNKVLKIYSAALEKAAHQKETGSYESDGKTYLRYACADGFIYVKEIQLEGKKRMAVEEFLRGNKIQ